MTTAPLEFWLPRPPDNANNREHWRVQLNKKNRFLRELHARLNIRHHMPPPPATPLERARLEVTYFHPTRRLLDSDNAVRRLKPVVDWLVEVGYLAGDTPDHLEWTIPRQTVGVRGLPPLCSVLLQLVPLDSLE